MMYDSRIPQSAISVSREALALSDAMRGQPAMTAGNVGMTNMDTGRAYANADGTAFGQMEEQAALAAQEVQQNMQTRQFQANAGGRGAAIKMNTEEANAKGEAQRFMNEKLVNVLDSKGGGEALMQFAALTQGIGKERMRDAMLTSRAMYDGKAPELGMFEGDNANLRYGLG